MDKFKLLHKINFQECPEFSNDLEELTRKHPGVESALNLAQSENVVAVLEKPNAKDILINVLPLEAPLRYDKETDMSAIISACQLPGINKVTQLVHDDERHRPIVPYDGAGKSTDVIAQHLITLKSFIVSTVRKLGLDISDMNVIQTSLPNGDTIMQIATYYVNNFNEGYAFASLVVKEMEEAKCDSLLILSVRAGFIKFKYKEDGFHFYPLMCKDPGFIMQHVAKNFSANASPLPIINIHFHNTTNIYNGNVQQTTVNGNNNNVKVAQINKKTKVQKGVTIIDFIEHIRRVKPDWCTRDTHITGTELCDRYMEFSGTQMDPRIFGRMLSKKLGNVKDGRKISLVRLMDPNIKNV